jgi:hypothetical protein
MTIYPKHYLKNLKEMKTIKLTEKDLMSLVNKVITEGYPEKEDVRKSTNFRKQDFEAYPREDKLKTIFGAYGDDIPPQVLQYLRKIGKRRLIDKINRAYEA